MPAYDIRRFHANRRAIEILLAIGWTDERIRDLLDGRTLAFERSALDPETDGFMRNWWEFADDGRSFEQFVADRKAEIAAKNSRRRDLWARFGDGRDYDAVEADLEAMERESAARDRESERTNPLRLLCRVKAGETRDDIEAEPQGPVADAVWDKTMEYAERTKGMVDASVDMMQDVERIDRERDERKVEIYPATLRRWSARGRPDMSQDEIRKLLMPPPGWAIDIHGATPEVVAVCRALGLPRDSDEIPPDGRPAEET